MSVRNMWSSMVSLVVAAAALAWSGVGLAGPIKMLVTSTGSDRVVQYDVDGTAVAFDKVFAQGLCAEANLDGPMGIAFGADGTIQWWWGPTDGRHYAAYAEATALIAELEEYFTKGEMQPQLLSGDEVPGSSRVAWQLQEKALVMFFNDGTSGPVTVTAQVPEGCHVLKRDNRGSSRLLGNALTMEIEPLNCRWVVLALPVP